MCCGAVLLQTRSPDTVAKCSVSECSSWLENLDKAARWHALANTVCRLRSSVSGQGNRAVPHPKYPWLESNVQNYRKVPTHFQLAFPDSVTIVTMEAECCTGNPNRLENIRKSKLQKHSYNMPSQHLASCSSVGQAALLVRHLIEQPSNDTHTLIVHVLLINNYPSEL